MEGKEMGGNEMKGNGREAMFMCKYEHKEGKIKRGREIKKKGKEWKRKEGKMRTR